MNSTAFSIKVALYRMLMKFKHKFSAHELQKFYSGLGSKKKCYVCNTTFNNFTKWRNKGKDSTEVAQIFDFIGSDPENYGCMFCRSSDRERHLFMYFDKLNLWEKMQGAKILHFAAERNLRVKINEQKPQEYLLADIAPKREGMVKIDATQIPYENESFDFLIANHILEHIPDHLKALSEFFRVLKPGGIAILQTPYSKLLKNNFQDENINTDKLRLFFYGLEDHVRTFGRTNLFENIEDAGFTLQIKLHEQFFTDKDAYYYGVNKHEELIQAIKPG